MLPVKLPPDATFLCESLLISSGACRGDFISSAAEAMAGAEGDVTGDVIVTNRKNRKLSTR
jgi:hypothetical protein